MFVMPISRAASVARRSHAVPAFGTSLDGLFDESLDRFYGGNRAEAESRTPAMDVAESDTAYTVVLDVPGATREQLKVSVDGRRVTLARTVAAAEDLPAAQDAAASDKKEKAEEAKPAQRLLYRERRAPSYARAIVLPTEVDQAASQAKFENGVLTLTLAKKVPAAATQLAIA